MTETRVSRNPISTAEEDRIAIDAAMRRVVADALHDVPAELADPARYALAGGGKRLRSRLCLAAYRAVAGRQHPLAGSTELYDLAAAVEVVHTYSLIHDDLPCMDDDDLRRGRPTTHRVFGSPRAVLAGAALLPLACAAVERAGRGLELHPGERAKLVRELCRAAGGGGMVGGQVSDLLAEGRSIRLAELESIHRRKTGALLAASVRIGAIAARADDALLAGLTDYANAVGLAFQIADDLLDVTGSTAKLGKDAGRDLELSKSTFPSLMGLDAARLRAENEITAATAALRGLRLDIVELELLARFAVDRDH